MFHLKNVNNEGENWGQALFTQRALGWQKFNFLDGCVPDDILNTERVVLPTAPKASRGPDVDPDRIPSEPPFTVRVSNLSYDLDLEDIQKFFKELKVWFMLHWIGLLGYWNTALASHSSYGKLDKADSSLLSDSFIFHFLSLICFAK